MNFSKSLRKYTFPVRLEISKRLTPGLYESRRLWMEQLSKTPHPMILFVKHHFDHNLVGAEIGVAAGVNALSMVQELPISKLYLIDPYMPYVEGSKQLGAEAETCFKEAKERLKQHSEKTEWLRMTSREAAGKIGNQLEFDFVYIDGNHSYEHVLEDLCLYYPLVKSNGVIGGHDYHYQEEDVIHAVNDFAYENRLHVNCKFPDFWMIKPTSV